MSDAHSGHIPVMIEDVLAALPPASTLLMDGTFGGGGYTRAMLEKYPYAQVVAIDRDPDAITRGAALQQQFGKRLHLAHTTFAHLDKALSEAGAAAGNTQQEGPDGIVFDLGVSSFQLDEAERGFSFMRDGPLDMRMGRTGPTAADLVATLSEEELANIFYIYGEERHSRRIAKHLIEKRRETPFTRTLELASAVAAAIPGGRREKIHPATRVFQALRIVVNDELAEVEQALDKAVNLIKVGGVVVVVSFHSLEDRIVKTRFRAAAGPRRHVNKYRTDADEAAGPRYSEEGGLQTPATAEAARNPRARSARMRVLKRVA